MDDFTAVYLRFRFYPGIFSQAVHRVYNVPGSTFLFNRFNKNRKLFFSYVF